MMGEKAGAQGRLFYQFDLDDVVPADHLLRKINAVLDLSDLRAQLAPYYSHTGRPSIDPGCWSSAIVAAFVPSGDFARKSGSTSRIGGFAD